MEARAQTLIIAPPGRMREGLHTLLADMPCIQVMGIVDDPRSVEEMAVPFPPALVLLETNGWDGEIGTVLARMKGKWRQVCCLALAVTPQQREAAVAAGADGVLLRGYSAAELCAAVVGLLERRDAKKEDAR